MGGHRAAGLAPRARHSPLPAPGLPCPAPRRKRAPDALLVPESGAFPRHGQEPFRVRQHRPRPRLGEQGHRDPPRASLQAPPERVVREPPPRPLQGFRAREGQAPRLLLALRAAKLERARPQPARQSARPDPSGRVHPQPRRPRAPLCRAH